MAVQLPGGLYDAFTERLDSTPTANRVYQQKLRTQAKMDALDEYDKQRINHINDTGVRDSDRQGFDTRLQQVRDYYNLNKDKIRKGNTAESYEYEKKFRDISTYVNQSKERTAKQDAAMKLYQDRLKTDGRLPNDFMEELRKNDFGIDAEGSQTFDIAKWLSRPKPYNQQSSLKAYADIKRTPTTRIEKIANEPLKLTEITEEKFDDGAKQVIAARAANDFENSYSFSDAVLNDIKDPVTRQKLEQIFKDNYGTIPQNNTDYATAYKLQELQPIIVKSKIIDNKDAIMTRNETFKKEQQQRSISASLQRMREMIAARQLPWMNATETATYIVNADKGAGVGGTVEFDADKYETLTGIEPSSNSDLRGDGNGGYIYGRKDGNGNFIEQGRVDAVTAQDRLTKAAAKNPIKNPALNNGNPKPKTGTTQPNKPTKGKLY